jgi:hypothetical protein
MAKNPDRSLESRFMRGALRTPTLQRVDIIPGRLAGLEPNDPVEGFMQQRIGFAPVHRDR